VPAGILLLGVEQYIPLTMYANSNAILGGGIEFLAADGLDVLGVKGGCIVIGPGKRLARVPHWSTWYTWVFFLSYVFEAETTSVACIPRAGLCCTRHVFVETRHTRHAFNALTG
jgi:hypothetical protein